MARATRLLAVTTLLATATAIYLYRDNHALEAALTARPTPAPTPVTSEALATAAPVGDPWTTTKRSAKLPTQGAGPTLPEEKSESRLTRRQRRTEEFAAMFGRTADETDAEYRARVGPMIAAGLALPRIRATETRREAELKAGVTPEQSKQLDQAFEKVYADVMDYTNKAVGDGVLSPYERNVAGWLEFAGGLGGMLGDAEATAGKILTPEQVKAMSSSGFEWGEYLGLSTPWETIQPPPPAN
jgi:hypothetical protein